MNNNEILQELRYIRGLLIHIALMIGSIGLILVLQDFQTSDLIFIAMLGIPSVGVSLISLKANFGGV